MSCDLLLPPLLKGGWPVELIRSDILDWVSWEKSLLSIYIKICQTKSCPCLETDYQHWLFTCLSLALQTASKTDKATTLSQGDVDRRLTDFWECISQRSGLALGVLGLHNLVELLGGEGQPALNLLWQAGLQSNIVGKVLQ